QLIKKYRLDQNMSQESLCKGICAISYLSKIEAGLVTASPDIISLLFDALHISYITDETFLAEGKDTLVAFFKAYFFQYIDECQRLFNILLVDEPKYLSSPLMLDYLFAKAFEASWHTPSDALSLIHDLSSYESTLDESKHYYLLFLQGKLHMDLKRDYDQAISFFSQANNLRQTSPGLALLSLCYFFKGQYPLSIDMNESAYKRAIDEGNISWALNICLTQAGSYSNMKNIYLMLKYYDRALNLCEGIGDLKYKEDIYYNLGATFLTLKDYAKALSYCLHSLALARVNHREHISLYHKLALIYLEIGNKEEASSYLTLAFEALAKDEEHQFSAMRKSLDIVAIRVEDPNYLYNPLYLETLEYVYNHIEKELHFGFKQFHGDYLITCYKANRRYKDALRVTEELYVEQAYFLT
ncbi:MAG: tetratricopeptide repeat protein, partial [Cellulosilyticaceae bacterium]